MESERTNYIYDGMRVIQERDDRNVPTVSYTRGTDSSGSLEGAGGIGGLLARSHGYLSGNWSTHNYYHSDGNGNVTYLVDASQSLAGKYRYDLYGNMISSSGSLANDNVYCFGNKERQTYDSHELYYYGYRCYEPNLHRWPNRDPLGEFGFEIMRSGKAEGMHTLTGVTELAEGPNLYTYVYNQPVRRKDPSGLQSPPGGGIPWGPPPPPFEPGGEGGNEDDSPYDPDNYEPNGIALLPSLIARCFWAIVNNFPRSSSPPPWPPATPPSGCSICPVNNPPGNLPCVILVASTRREKSSRAHA